MIDDEQSTDQTNTNDDGQQEMLLEAPAVPVKTSVKDPKPPKVKIPKEKKPRVRSANDIEKGRRTKTLVFHTPEEFEYVESIVKARQESGITRDWSHFLRQCVDFAINVDVENIKKGVKFATGKTEPTYLHDAFFNSK